MFCDIYRKQLSLLTKNAGTYVKFKNLYTGLPGSYSSYFV